jgi:hypothetical protein
VKLDEYFCEKVDFSVSGYMACGSYVNYHLHCASVYKIRGGVINLCVDVQHIY